MYRLHLLRSEIWLILDERDEEVFQGSLTDCEAWLDAQEHQGFPTGLYRKSRSGWRQWLPSWWNPEAAILPSVARTASSQLPQRN